MKYEIELVRTIHERVGLPIRAEAPAKIERDEGAARRRMIRVESDGLIREGLLASNMEEICAALGGTTTAVAGACLQFGIDPKVPDLIAAAKELIEDARLVLDQAIALSEVDQIAVGAVMMEIVLRGLAATLSIPYRGVIDACAFFYLNGQKADRAVLGKLIEGARAQADAAAAAMDAPSVPEEVEGAAAASPQQPASLETVTGETREKCPDCGREKAASANDCAEGLCPKWYAIRDPEADADCARVAAAARKPRIHLEYDGRIICGAEDLPEGDSALPSNVLAFCPPEGSEMCGACLKASPGVIPPYED